MNDNKLANLGTSVVLDPDDMQVGNHVFMGSILCEITEIEGERVVVRPVVGWNLFVYRLKKHRVAIAVICILAAAVASYRWLT